MKALLITFFSLFLALGVGNAYAIDLDTAKQEKLIGETDTGYIAATGAANDETKALIDNINGKRKQYYQKLADKNNVSLASIEVLAGEKAIAKTGVGLMVRVDGKWSTK